MSEDGGVFTDGAQITRDELRFARFVIRIQRQFATALRDSFIIHLKLKNLWKQYKLKERSINIEFNVPTSFMAMRDQQLLDLKFNNFNNATQNQSIAPSYAQKYFLDLSDELMKENREWLKKDAALRWELGQIEANGPNFREQAAAIAGAGEPAGGMPMGGGAGGGTSEIPEFGGSAPVGGEEAGVAAGGVPGGEAGAPATAGPAGPVGGPAAAPTPPTTPA